MNKLRLIGAAALAVIMISVFAYQLQPQEGTETIDTLDRLQVAELLHRGEAIQYGKEWDYVQNSYADLTNLIKADPTDSKAKIQLAQLFVKEARVTGEHGHYYPAALALLNSTINQAADDKDMLFLALTHKSGVLLSLHEFEQALQVGTRAAQLNPVNAQIHGVLVDAHVELGAYDEAVLLLDRMLQIKPDIRSYSRASYLREIHGDVAGSIEAMSMAVKAGYPGYEETAWAMLTLAEVYHQYGMVQEAIAVYDQILATRKDYPFAIAGKAEIMIEQGKYSEAEKALLQAIEIIPEVGYYISLAKLYKSQDRVDEMNELNQEILAMLKDDTDSGHNMNMEYADVYIDLLDEPTRGIEYAQIEYSKRPKNIDVNRLMARALIALGNYQEAESYIVAAGVTGSKHPELIDLRTTSVQRLSTVERLSSFTSFI